MTDVEKNVDVEKNAATVHTVPSAVSVPPTIASSLTINGLDPLKASEVSEVSEVAVPEPQPPSPPPDGGAHAWMTVAGCFLALFVQFGLTNAFGVFQSYYEHNFLSAYSPDNISWIGGLQQFLLFFGGLWAGRALDAYGAHAVMVPGSIAIVLSLMLTSLCTRYYQFILAQGVLFGLGSACIFAPGFALPSQWFAKRRALATAIAVSGSGLGGTLWPIALNRLIDQVGFGWTLRIAGFISLALLAAANALIRTRLPRRKPYPIKSTFLPFKEPSYALLAGGLMLCTWSMFNPFFYIALNASRLGASPSLAFYCVSFLNAGSTLGRLFAGIGDRLGRFNVLAGTTGVISILLLAFWIPLNSVPALIAFAVIYGFFVGFIISLLPPAIATISKPHEIGARVGLVYSCGSVFVLTGPPISGAFLTAYPGDRGWQYIGVFSGVLAAVATVLITIARFKIQPKAWVIV